MLENARQGFWNGAHPPFGYRTVEAERRGQRIKKRLEVEPKEAETVRLIFKLFLEGDGTKGPMGVKDIASWLNARSFGNGRDNPFYTGTVHRILTRESYTGVHHYNCHDSRTRREHPKEEWVAVQVPQSSGRAVPARATAVKGASSRRDTSANHKQLCPSDWPCTLPQLRRRLDAEHGQEPAISLLHLRQPSA